MQLNERLRKLEAKHASQPAAPCPYCQAVEAMTDQELTDIIEYLDCISRDLPISPELRNRAQELMLPEPSTSCPKCGRYAAMTEDEIDARLGGLE